MTDPAPIDLEARPCPVGCAPDDEDVLTGRDRLHGLPGEFTVVRCRVCGLMRTNPRPAPEVIAAYYPESYGPYESTRIDDAAKSGRPPWQRAIRRMVDFRNHSVPPLAPGKLLEIGCASGRFLHEMATQGWEAHGIEFSPKAATHARQLGFRVHTGTVEHAPDPGEPFDLVAGWMVLEHLHEPVAALQRLRSWARPTSWLAISTPNVASVDFRVFGDAWYALSLPTHLFHFTPATLARVLDAGGWRVERVMHQRVLTNWVASVGYRLQDTGWLIALANRLAAFPRHARGAHYVLYPIAAALAAARQTGRITVWARPNQ